MDERGRYPVEEFIEEVPLKERVKITAYLRELRRQGHNLRRPIADYLGEGIYELRPRGNRIFYFFFLRDVAVLLHAIRKNTDKIPVNDRELCLKRKQQVEEFGDIKILNF
jgi:phage-related protein